MQLVRMRTEAFGSDSVSEPKASWDYVERLWSVETLSNWAVDGEPGAPKWSPTRAGDQAVLHEGENLELLAHLAAKAVVDCVFCPLKQLRVPSWAVIQRDRRDSTEDVVGSGAISQIRRQALP
jgi:hypothetical protein